MNKAVQQSEGASPKKRSKCLTCCIVCLVVLVVLTAAVIAGSAIAFNKFVSPMIGGVKFGAALSLLSGTLHSKESKIVTDPYDEQDLDDLYASLNTATYQTVKSDTELEQEYNALSQEEQAKISLTEYKEQNRYTITVAKLMDALDVDELINGEQKEEQPSQDEETATAEDVEEGQEQQTDNKDSEMLNKLLGELHFDFSPLKRYNYLSEQEDEAYTTFKITGNQIAALVGEVMRQVLKKMDIAKMAGDFGKNIDFSNFDLTKYVGIPQVLFAYTGQKPAEGASDEEIEAYRKSVCVTATVKMDFKGLLKTDEIAAMVKGVAMDTVGNEFVGNLALGALKTFLPKRLFVTASIYPLDEQKDMVVKINNYSDKNAATLATIIDHFAVEEEDGTKKDVFGTGAQDRSMMGQLNAYVVKSLQGIDDTVPLEFVDSDTGAQLRLAHIQMLLSLMKLYNPEDLEHSVTPHMFLTTLRCLIDEAEAVKVQADLAPFYSELEAKYGIDSAYWEDHSLLDTSTMDDLVNQIDVNQVDFDTNERMKVSVYQDQLTTLIADALSKGLLTGDSAAAEEEGAEEDKNELLSHLSFDSLVISEVLKTADHTDYCLSANASIDLAGLLGEYIKEESAIVNSLTEALPKALCFGLNVYVRDTLDEEGNVQHAVGAIEVSSDRFVNETGITINKFNEEYTDKVLHTIALMISTLGGSDDFNVDSVSSMIEDAFRQVFDAIEDNLYCSINIGEDDVDGAKKGKLLLPSLYEIVRGLSIKQVNESDTLSMADVLSLGEIREVFRTLYNYKGEPAAYQQGAADDFLDDIKVKYYLTEDWTIDDVMNGNVADKLSADSIDFGSMYADHTAVGSLNVPLSGDALADLIKQSGKLDDLDMGGDEDSVIKGIEVVNCSYTLLNGGLYLNFVCQASMQAEESAAAEDKDGFDFGKLLPNKIFVTGSTLINNQAGYHVDGVEDDLPSRFDSSVMLNESAEVVTYISKLLKVFGNSSIDTDSFAGNIATSMENTFSGIESNINLVYGTTEGKELSLANIYNTINKRSHDGDDSYNLLTPAQKAADDQRLADLMREVGRNPQATYKTGDDSDIIATLDVDSFDTANVYSHADETAFFNDVNRNYYVDDDKKITADKINDPTFSIGNDVVDFRKIYGDTRAYSELVTVVTEKRFAALSNSLYKDGITVDNMGTATILQVNITPTLLQLLIQVHNTQENDTGKIMPAYLYVTSVTSLVDGDDYLTTCAINDLGKADTDEFIDRLNLLKHAFEFDFDIDTDTISKPIQDSVRELFNDKINTFGSIEILDGSINLPTMFRFLVDGSYADKEVRDTYVMYDVNEEGLYIDKDGNVVGESERVRLDPETLMNRMREFGRADSDAYALTHDYAANIYVWDDHRPSTTNGKYNTNLISSDEETAFYQRLQGYYFFKNTPDQTWFDGSSNMFDDLTGSKLKETFNLYGSTVSLPYDDDYIGLAEQSVLNTHIANGLYNYRNNQYGVNLKDSAMGSLVNSQGVMNKEGNLSDAVERMDITAFSIKNVSGTTLTIEITTKVTSKSEGSAAGSMPTEFYITTVTTRDSAVTGDGRYHTTVSLNGMQPSDVKRLLKNIDVLQSFDISSQLDMDKISKNVEDALKELLDDKLEKYVDHYEDGGMQFHSVYYHIVENLTIDSSKYAYSHQIAELDVQQMMVKLHTPVSALTSNPQGGEVIHDGLNVTMTDRAFGAKVSNLIEADIDVKDYVDVKQSVFFTGTKATRGWDDDMWDTWQNIIASRKDDFAFATGKNYITVTSMVTFSATSSVSFLPDYEGDPTKQYVYATVVIDSDKALGTDPLVFDDFAVNDLTEREQQLLMASVTFNDSKLTTAKTKMVEKINELFAAYALFDITYSQGTQSDEYIGKFVASTH